MNPNPGHCPYCGEHMTRPQKGSQFHSVFRPTDRTRDHIRPRVWQGDDSAENIRRCCRNCNELRARCGHCPAALMLAIDVARDRGVGFAAIVDLWRLPTINIAKPSSPSHGYAAKPGHLATPSVLDANGRIVPNYIIEQSYPVGRQVERALTQLYGAKVVARIRSNKITVAQASEQLERRLAKAEARRLRKKAQEMAAEREQHGNDPGLPMNGKFRPLGEAVRR